MRRRFLSHLTYANVMSTLAVVLVIGGGAAYAANTIISTDIVNNEVYGADVRDDTLAGGGLGHVDLKAGSVRSSEVGADSLTGADVLESGLGTVPDADVLDGKDSKDFARLGGLINGDGTISQGTGFTVTHPNDGEYQVQFPSGTLGVTCPPIVTATPFAGIVRHPQLSGRGCSGLGAGNFTIKMLDNDGVAHDTPFLFIAM